MIRSIAIRRNQHCWGSLNEDFAPPQQNPHSNGYSNPTRVSVTLLKRTRAGAREVASIRIRVGSGRAHRCKFQTRTNDLARLDSQSARVSPACADTGGLSAVSSSAARLRFEFFPALKASGDLLFPLRVQPAKQSRGGFTDSLRSFVSSCSHAWIRAHGVSRWKAKVFPNLTKVLAKVK